MTSMRAFLKRMQEHHNGAISTKSDAIPPLEEWDLDLEVSNQVY